MTKITIIGAGIIGSAIAYELSLNPKFDITLLDRNPPASGCTSAALGVLMGIISHKTKGQAWQLRETSIQRYKTLIPELEELTGKQLSYNHQGIVKLLFPEDNREKWHKLQQTRHSQGWDLQIWEHLELKEKLPHLDIKQNNIIGAIYSPQDAQVNPSQLTQALISGAKINGVNCHFDSKVENIKATPINSTIYTNIGEFKTDWLIITAGLGTTLLTKCLQEPVDIRPVLGQALHLKLDYPSANIDFQPVVTGNDVHIVPLGKGEYWVGATVEFPDDNGEVIAQQELLEELKQNAFKFCPNLSKASIIKHWSGKRPRPHQQPAPIIKKLLGYNQVLLASGHYRNGVLLAPATALKIKEILI